MKRIIFIAILFLSVRILAQEKQKTTVEIAQAKLQELQKQYQQVDDNYKKVTGEYFLSIQALQQQASVYQQIIKENEVKKEEVKK